MIIPYFRTYFRNFSLCSGKLYFLVTPSVQLSAFASHAGDQSGFYFVLESERLGACTLCRTNGGIRRRLFDCDCEDSTTWIRLSAILILSAGTSACLSVYQPYKVLLLIKRLSGRPGKQKSSLLSVGSKNMYFAVTRELLEFAPPCFRK